MEKAIEQLIPIFNNIYQKLSNGADLGWNVVVKQQVIEGYFDFFTGLFLLIVYITISFYIIRGIKNDKNNELDKESYPNLLLLSLFFFILILKFFWDGIPRIINPEFYAINYFINLLK